MYFSKVILKLGQNSTIPVKNINKICSLGFYIELCKPIENFGSLSNKMNFSTLNLDPQQELLLKENCILVDNDDKPIGSASKEICHLLGPNGSPPPLHRAFSVFLFNSKKELLLQQRSSHKITFPNYFTNTCCSHPLSVPEEMDEKNFKGIKVAARRRLNFELGIPENEVNLEELQYLTRIHYASPSLGGRWGEHEIDYILMLQKDVSLNINENEISDIDYVSKYNLKPYLRSLEERGIHITPWFKLIVDKFLPLWWDNLDDLSRFRDHQSIHRM